VQTPNDCGYYQWIDREATKHERTLLKDLRDTVWQMKRDEVEHKQLIDQVNRKNEELTQVIIGLEKERDELNLKLHEIKVEMLQMASKKIEGSTWWIVKWFVLVTVVGLFMVFFKKEG
jgi:hypothetical protein